MDKTWILSVSELLFLTICAVEDYRNRKISIYYCMIFGMMGLLEVALLHPFPWYSFFGGIGIGMVIILISKLDYAGIGEGDGWIFCVTGIYTGISANLALLLGAGWLCAGYALAGVALKKYEKKDRLAFAPFILVAQVILWMLR